MAEQRPSPFLIEFMTIGVIDARPHARPIGFRAESGIIWLSWLGEEVEPNKGGEKTRHSLRGEVERRPRSASGAQLTFSNYLALWEILEGLGTFLD